MSSRQSKDGVATKQQQQLQQQQALLQQQYQQRQQQFETAATMVLIDTVRDQPHPGTGKFDMVAEQ
eukprot:3851802-Amphidinium_carterae.1